MEERGGSRGPSNTNAVQAVLAALESSQLLGPPELEAAAGTLEAAAPGSTVEAAALLEKRGILSAYQAGELAAGRLDECILAGRYRIMDRLGAGGMGVVFRGVDRKLDRMVAVKVLPAERLRDAGAAARFEREGRALAKLSHPGIVQAYDSGTDRDRHFLVMEYVEGTSLKDMLADRGQLSPAAAADYIHQAARALEHAHARGLVHRDLKPSNLLVTARGEVKLLDLGLARFLQDQISDSRLTLEGMGMGTPDYMAPEQFQSARRADERSDVYGLGCTLYEALSGKVPFPGSSLEEKARAHEEAEPPPLEDSSSECPAGLILAVRRMMAKQPQNRFQSAREAAEAIAPYVAGSSVSAAAVRAEASWRGSQLAISLPARQSRRGLAIAAVLTAVVAALLLAAAFATRAGRDRAADGARPAAAGVETPRPAPAEGVIVVAADGSGQFTTIGEALAAAKPGATVRVRAGKYREMIAINSASQHSGLTLEADEGALIEDPFGETTIRGQQRTIVLVQNVPGVVLRGFSIRTKGSAPTLVGVSGRARGTRIEDLQLDGGQAGILLEPQIAADEPPVVVTGSTVRGAIHGIFCAAIIGDNPAAVIACRRAVVRDNVIERCSLGIHVLGPAREILIAGNRILGSTLAGIQLALPGEGQADILVANNTVLESAAAFRLWDGELKCEGVEISGNIFLAAAGGADAMYLDSGGTALNLKGPGDGRLLLERWKFRQNWREVLKPTENDVMSRSWIPPGPADHISEKIDLLSRDPANADYLRPAAGSPLASGGAGADDPTLPAHAGAVPPAGAAPWDWQKTWEARHPKKVLTVSQNEADGGEFRTIGAALEKARPGMTIRVLDDAVYREDLFLHRKDAHAGITLEATNRATLEPVSSSKLISVLRINVPSVTVRGFRLRALNEVYMILVFGRAPGAVFEGLNFERAPGGQYVGFSLEGLNIQPDEAPLVIRGCTVRSAIKAVRISGIDNDETALPCGRIVVCDSLLEDSEIAIEAGGAIHDVIIAGNRIVGSIKAGIQIENLFPGSRQIVVVNNTFFSCKSPIDVWDAGVKGETIEIRGNLFLDAVGLDIALFQSTGDPQAPRRPGDGATLLSAWKWGGNWREGEPPAAGATDAKAWVPVADGDTLLPSIGGVGRDRQDAGFLRPARESPLATGGAGRDDPGLPGYAGALPPEGTEPWDWRKTWESRKGSSGEH